MSNLENLSSKIVEDASIKAEAILKEAKDNGALIIENKVKGAKGLELQMLEKAKIEAVTVKQRIISNAKLTVRNEKLVAMQKMIDKVFAKSLENLLVMGENEYLELVKKYLLSMPIAGDEEIILPGKYKSIMSEDYLSQINTGLKAAGKIGEIKLSEQPRDINSGFIVLKNGIEINNTFESLVNSLRAELEPEIVEELFK
ncbi:V-type ATP synthase subunit E [Clostridium tagluense]|uniref:V-type ATP synthase subunit E n=1 Tax=Clostridium tagluense TaxID=360422 RepID=UPI001CF28BCD|nr:V-type ATP synthase subunit E family protein [Clostridium tagluense]MCB2311561.1 V-type ATP synthase subunit E [Clostridium tagluense]MCB2316285.1 V-type ATP synthase subunit E [Clostridium tagluense]MCB2321139.1 V-type ATP synthase subunit E [Clostridium tagluense]MCB2326154.1 V-type ATP synthase subunit E [Clostridium tagluense]MCB2330877.1 V-type ATP synthase subunit E [Clostridium tagluense]